MLDDDFEEEMANKEYDRLKNEPEEMKKIKMTAFERSFLYAQKQYDSYLNRGY